MTEVKVYAVSNVDRNLFFVTAVVMCFLGLISRPGILCVGKVYWEGL